MADLILASASPRRADLLRQLGVDFEVQAADIDETPAAGESPEDYVQRLAREKSAAIVRLSGNTLPPVLAADTSVVLDGQILGKPADRLDALAMLARLSGREHRVLTGLCLRSGQLIREQLSVTRVTFQTLTQAQCEAYIDTGEPFGKAGAYAIQGLGGAMVESITGSYTGVVGLPLAESWQLLRAMAVPTGLEGS